MRQSDRVVGRLLRFHEQGASLRDVLRAAFTMGERHGAAMRRAEERIENASTPRPSRRRSARA